MKEQQADRPPLEGKDFFLSESTSMKSNSHVVNGQVFFFFFFHMYAKAETDLQLDQLQFFFLSFVLPPFLPLCFLPSFIFPFCITVFYVVFPNLLVFNRARQTKAARD